MERNPLTSLPSRASAGAFHDYVRGVFADRSRAASHLRAARAAWLRAFASRAATSRAVQRWEGEGGSSR